MKLLQKMREAKNLTPSEKYIVEYVFDHLDEIMNVSITKLSEKTFTSTATIMRLCSKMGMPSYIDFRLELSWELMQYNQESILHTAQTPVDRFDSLHDIIVKVSNQNAKSIIDTIILNTPEDLEAIVKEMANAKRIDFYGVGPSNVVAKDAQIKCMRLGIASNAYNDRVSMLVNAKAYWKETIAFLISYTGMTTEIIEVAQALKQVKVKTISLTSTKKNELQDLCDFNIFVDSSESWNRLGGMSSRISTLNMIDILFTALINSNYVRFSDLIRNTEVSNIR